MKRGPCRFHARICMCHHTPQDRTQQLPPPPAPLSHRARPLACFLLHAPKQTRCVIKQDSKSGYTQDRPALTTRTSTAPTNKGRPQTSRTGPKAPDGRSEHHPWASQRLDQSSLLHRPITILCRVQRCRNRRHLQTFQVFLARLLLELPPRRLNAALMQPKSQLKRHIAATLGRRRRGTTHREPGNSLRRRGS